MSTRPGCESCSCLCAASCIAPWQQRQQGAVLPSMRGWEVPAQSTGMSQDTQVISGARGGAGARGGRGGPFLNPKFKNPNTRRRARERPAGPGPQAQGVGTALRRGCGDRLRRRLPLPHHHRGGAPASPAPACARQPRLLAGRCSAHLHGRSEHVSNPEEILTWCPCSPRWRT